MTLSLLIKNLELKGRWVDATHFICLIGIFVVPLCKGRAVQAPTWDVPIGSLVLDVKKEAKRIRPA